MDTKLTVKRIDTDVLIIGGGTAGCFAAVTLGKMSGVRVLIAEKADIRRSGCLAAGVNALNAYITKGHTPQSYADYAMRDAAGIAREDLLLTMSERLNAVTAQMERMGLVILKDQNGDYAARGNRNIKINGENIKPLLADAVKKQKNVSVLNHVNMTRLKTRKMGEKTVVVGACGFDVNDPYFYDIDARAVLCACGGAAGLYRPNNPGFSRHKMWYPPFNTGGGYAMGILAGAEMTTFEMRFIALRCADTIAPTGTIAQGVGARQINAHGEIYETRYGVSTSERVWGTTLENEAGRGPCCLKTAGISAEAQQDLYRAYLNMAPAQTLRWIEEGKGPAEENVEITGTEPYVVGGHTASGYWVDRNRRTTLTGLYAAGDAAGGCPQKYVTGALAEGEIAAEAILEYIAALKSGRSECQSSITAGETPERSRVSGGQADAECRRLTAFLNQPAGPFSTDDLEEAMQKIMDQYAGGISAGYRYSRASLAAAEEKIGGIDALAGSLAAQDMDDLLRISELLERLTVCHVLLRHMEARKETRWHSFGEYTEYPKKSEHWHLFVNSRMEQGKIRMILRSMDGKTYGRETV